MAHLRSFLSMTEIDNLVRETERENFITEDILLQARSQVTMVGPTPANRTTWVPAPCFQHRARGRDSLCKVRTVEPGITKWDGAWAARTSIREGSLPLHPLPHCDPMITTSLVIGPGAEAVVVAP
uniref:Uncharacterized protein n=1 Tax=Cacopsylla melanoneura TaxID=428564 RepID=A0A8D8QXG7_9HEMI